MIKSLVHICLAIALVVGLSVGVLAATQDRGSVWAVSDGKGSVSLFWIGGSSIPQGGWKLERLSSNKTTVVVGKLGPLFDEEAVKGLDAKTSAGLREFAGKLKAGKLTRAEMEQALFVFGLKAMVDPVFGNALGLRYADRGLARGEISYRVTGMDAQGRAIITLQSQKIDPLIETPSPASISALKGEIKDDNGIFLTWTKPPVNQKNPVVAYHIERVDPGAKITVLTPKPLLIAEDTGKKKKDTETALPGYIDRKPPVETSVTYIVYGLDMFLRKSNPVNMSIFVPDKDALVPPAQVNAKAGGNRVELKWKAKDNSNTAGYIVERSFTAGGVYETVTKEKLSRGTDSYSDTNLMAARNYYYRLRSVNRRGEVGTPSLIVMGRPDNRDALSKPEGAKAEVGVSRVRLTWEPIKPVPAGYIIERKSDNSDRWMRMNETLSPEPHYNDHFGAGNGAKLRYRVIAVGIDNKQSSTSSEIEVALPDNLPPATPHITDINGKGGKITITFRPAHPDVETYQFLILRSSAPKELGLVLGDALPGNVRTFEDTFVEAGNEYWYSLVALDKAGNRSDPSRPVVVRAGTPNIPKPKKPDVKLVNNPFEHVAINFEKAPFGLQAIVQATENQVKGWKTIFGPGGDFSQAIDQDPPKKGKAFYRIIYQATNGVMGDPSESAEFSR